MRKFLCIMILLVSTLLMADLQDCQITVSSGDVNAGDSILVTVSTSELMEEWDVISFQFEMYYDPSAVSFSSYYEGDLFDEGLLLMNELEPGTIRAAYSHYIAETGSGIIIRLYFTGITGQTELDIHDFKYNATAIENTVNGSITVIGGNQRPVADAGEDIEVAEGALVELDGSASYDPEGNNITYLWTAPNAITLDDPTSATPSFTAPDVTEDTQFPITLVVNDGDHNSLPDEVIVTVLNVNTLDDIPAQIIKADIHSISPNPFNPSTSINLLVPWDETELVVRIYSIKGQLVKSYHLSGLTPNTVKQLTWSGLDDRDRQVATGVYLCSVQCRHSKSQKRMLLLK